MKKKPNESASYPWEEGDGYAKGLQGSIWGTFLVALAAIAIAVAFNARALVAWADALQDPLAREIAMTATEALAAPLEAWGVGLPGRLAREWFLAHTRSGGAPSSGASEPDMRYASGADSAEGGKRGALLASAAGADGSNASGANPDASSPVSVSAIASGSAAPSPASSSPRMTVIADVPTSIRHRAAREAYSASNPIRILFVGDSLAQLSTSDAFLAWDKETDWAEVTMSTKISSSLSNPRVIDWHTQIRSLTEKSPYDCIIVMIGSNDAQGISSGRKSLAFNTPEWLATYDERVLDFMGVMADRSWKVYWTAVPPMRNEGYRERMTLLNDRLRSLCPSFANARFVDVKTIVGNEAGLYTNTKIIDGVQRVIRNVDGVHMDYYGGMLIVDEYERMLLEDFMVEGVNFVALKPGEE